MGAALHRNGRTVIAAAARWAVVVLFALVLGGCATACLIRHGLPDETEEFRDVQLDAGHYEIILPYTEMIACVKYRVPPGPIAANRASDLCPKGYDILVDGEMRPSPGPAAEELVWEIKCRN